MVDSDFPDKIDRDDPYRTYRFRLRWDGRYVAGVSSVSALTRTTQAVSHPSGGDPASPRPIPGQSAYQAITLERGVTHDPAFEQWANKVWDYTNLPKDEQGGGAGEQVVSLKDFRKDIVLEIYNEAGQKVMAYNIYRCWPSEFTAVPELDAHANAVAIGTLKLENEGWQRDHPSATEPDEPSFVSPAEA